MKSFVAEIKVVEVQVTELKHLVQVLVQHVPTVACSDLFEVLVEQVEKLAVNVAFGKMQLVAEVKDLVPFEFAVVEYGVLRWSVGVAPDLLEQL